MMKRLDNILLGLFWIVAVTLGASFWFNLKFAFNIFSASHWHYLSALQAERANIASGFYISLAVCIIIAFAGVYIIIRPRRRIKITTGNGAPDVKKNESHTNVAIPAETTVDNTASTVELPHAEPAAPIAPMPARPSVRPPRLNLAMGAMPPPQKMQQTSVPAVSEPAPAPRIDDDEREYPEIADIFRNTGYFVKKPVRIRGILPALIAIGPDDQLWVGVVGMNSEYLEMIVERFRNVFIDTLDTIEIAIHGFVVQPVDEVAPNLISFDTIDMLRQYMEMHPAPRVDYDDENVTAYSEYIDTVLNYISKS